MNAINYLQVQKHILYCADHLTTVPLRLSCRSHHLSKSLLNATASPASLSPMMVSSFRISPSLQLELLMLILLRCLCCRDNAATPLPKSRPWISGTVQSHLHPNETANMCRVREGKLGCKLRPVNYLRQCKRAEHAGKKVFIRWAYLAV